jgi:hypothetical protein
VEFRPYRLGLGRLHLVEDGQAVLPGQVGAVVMTEGVVGVAQVVQCAGFEVPVSYLLNEFDGALIAADGFDVVAEVMVGVSKAVSHAVIT